MRGLLHQLSTIDTDAEAAVGWIASFDQLIARHADLNEIVRSTAGLAGCIAGLNDGIHEIDICVGSDGRDVEGDDLPADCTSRAIVGDANSIAVWLQRPNGAMPHDEIIVERMAFAVAVTLDRMYTPREQLNGAHALGELIDGSLEESERKWAAQLLCLESVESLRVLAISQEENLQNEISVSVRDFVRALQANGEIARVARVDNVAVLITTAACPEAMLPNDLRAGIGSQVAVLNAPTSWFEARALLRFTVDMPGMRVSHFSKYEDQGSLVALTMSPIDFLRQLPEVAGLEMLATTSTGRNSIEALDSYIRNGSMRGAAVELFLHHTSVAGRLDHASEVLGFSVADPAGTFRAKLALTNWQLTRASN